MVNLTIGNSYSRLTGLSPKQEKEIRKALSYKVSDYSSNFRSRTRYLIDKRGNFPSGLLQRALRHIGFNECVSSDNRTEPKNKVYNNLSLPFNPYMEQYEAAFTGKDLLRGSITMPTGVGKSAVIALLINQLKVRTLIVVPNLSLKKQLTDTFNAWFGKDSMRYITIENIGSSNLWKDGNYDCLIIDESHHVAAKTYRDLNKKMWNGIYYRFFFTATPYRSKEEEQMLMEAISGKVIYSLDFKTAIEKQYIVPVEAYYIDLPKVRVKGNSWPSVYKQLVTGRADRNEEIKKMMFSCNFCGSSCLTLVKEISHGEELSWDGAFSFVNGEDQDSKNRLEEFAEGKRKVIVGTTGVCGEGVDTKACEYVIIAGLGKSKNQFMQQVGRALRKYPGKISAKVILFRDPSHKWTLNHFNAQKKILKEEFGIIPARL